MKSVCCSGNDDLCRKLGENTEARGRRGSRTRTRTVGEALAAVLVLLTAQSLAPSAPEETIELSPRTHREVWKSGRTGKVLKDIEWTTKPVIHLKDGDVEVTIGHSECGGHPLQPPAHHRVT